MGEAADLMLEGILCQSCGGLLDDVTEDSDIPGFPMNCSDCEGE